MQYLTFSVWPYKCQISSPSGVLFNLNAQLGKRMYFKWDSIILFILSMLTINMSSLGTVLYRERILRVKHTRGCKPNLKVVTQFL